MTKGDAFNVNCGAPAEMRTPKRVGPISILALPRFSWIGRRALRALDGPGPVIVGGTLFVNSGYAFWGAAPENVLLAFSVDGK